MRVPGRGFLPLTTRRLEIRALDRRDITRFTHYRNLVDVWRYQDWDVPYTRDHAHSLIDSQEGITGPVLGAWVQLAVDDGGGLAGDIAVWLDPAGQLAMVGYTLAPEAQGRGYATEAVGAVVDRLFAKSRVHRVAATLDPRNLESARVLERLGFRYEGCALRAALVRGEWEDDDRYAILADERRAWVRRPQGPPALVELVDVTHDNVRRVSALGTHRSQRAFVATVAESFGDALVPEEVDGARVVPWFRAIAADGGLVGFVMIAERTEAHPVTFLWRLLIDRRHQRRGIGERALDLIAGKLLTDGEHRLLTSWVPGRGSPESFYRRLGFEPTGVVIDGEIEAGVELVELRRRVGWRTADAVRARR